MYISSAQTFLGKGPQILLWSGSRTECVQITVCATKKVQIIMYVFYSTRNLKM